MTSRRHILPMADKANRPGEVRDAIVAHIREAGEASATEILRAAEKRLGRKVPGSSVRSYLNLNVGTIFERTKWGHYKLIE